MIYRALLSSELEEIYAQAPLAPNCVAHSLVRKAHPQATGRYAGTSWTFPQVTKFDIPCTQGPSSQSVKKRWPTKDDDCPICYETIFSIAESRLKFCDAYGINEIDVRL